MMRKAADNHVIFALKLCVAVLGLATVCASAADWPCHRGDLARSARTDERLDLPLALRWVYVPAQPPCPAWPDPVKEPHRMPFDYAPAPVVADGLVFFGSSADDTVRALEVTSGDARWRFTAGGPVRFAPQFWDGRLYVASDDGFLYCLRADTGGLLWKFRAGLSDRMVLGNGRMISRWPLRSGVQVDAGMAYITAGMWPAEGVFVYALDAGTGDLRWCNDTCDTLYMAQPHTGAYALTGVAPQGHLAATEHLLVVPTGRAVPAVFERGTGKLLHYKQAQNKIQGGSWVALDEELDVLYNTTNWGVHAYRLSSGRLIDNKAFQNPESNYVPPHHVQAGRVLVGGGQGVVTATDTGNGQELWRAPVDGLARHLAVANGSLFAATDTGRIYCFAPESGTTPASRSPLEPKPASGGAEPGSIAADVLGELARRNITKGYALVIGRPEDNLTEALARHTRLHVVNVLPTEDAARRERGRLLDETGLYGSRISVQGVEEPHQLPFPAFFANVIVSADVPGPELAGELYRVLRPCGGTMFLPGGSAALVRVLQRGAGVPSGEIYTSERGLRVVRGKLRGAFDWDSETTCDRRLHTPLELTWFGGPGPARMKDRHWGPPSPRMANGRYVVTGTHHIFAVDAYNGTELWSRFVPYAQGRYCRTVRSVAADDSCVYLNLGPVCYQLDAQTGKQKGVYGSFEEPERYRLNRPRRFEAAIDREHSGAVTLRQTAAGLELELTTRDPRLTELDSWELFFDFRAPARRFNLYNPGVCQVYVQTGTGELRPRMFYAEQVWPGDDPGSHPEVTVEKAPAEAGTSVLLRMSWEAIEEFAGRRPHEFGFATTLVSFDGLSGEVHVRKHLLGDRWSGICNSGWPVFVLDERRGTADAPEVSAPVKSLASLPDRALRWGRMPSRGRQDSPLGVRLGAFTGEGEDLFGDRSGDYYTRAYGCGGVIPSANMDFFRSGTLGYYDLTEDSGLKNFGAIRPGCALTMVPAMGLLISNEGSSGCICSYNFQCSFALAPTNRQRSEDWATYREPVPLGEPIDRLAVNLGAPGDRRDGDGRLWLGFPRRLGVEAQKAVALPLHVETDGRPGPYRFDSDRTAVRGTDRPWIYASGIKGLRRAVLDLAFYDTEYSCPSLPCAEPPVLDGRLDDPVWGGSRRIILSDRNDATLYMRHDDQHLYVAYRQPAEQNRRGERRPWRMAAQGGDAPLWDDDCLEMRFGAPHGPRGDLIRLGLSASGARYDSRWDPVFDVPRVQDLALDAGVTDWGSDGLQFTCGPGAYGRLAWDERGIWLLVSLPEKAVERDEELPVSDLAFMIANPGSTDYLELGIDLDGLDAQPSYRLKDEKPRRPVTLAEDTREDRYFAEALIPLEDLGLAAEVGAEVGLPMWFCADKSEFSRQQDERLRASFLNERTWPTITRLRLASQADPPTRLRFSIDGQWPGLAYLTKSEDPSWDGDWSSRCRVTDDAFVAELSIPWRMLDELGIGRRNMGVDLTGEGALDAVPRHPWQERPFAHVGRRLVLEETVPPIRRYRVRLHFCEPDRVKVGRRIFDVRVQDKLALDDLDIVRETGGKNRALVRELKGVAADKTLLLEFIPQGHGPGETNAAVLSGLEVYEEPVRRTGGALRAERGVGWASHPGTRPTDSGE